MSHTSTIWAAVPLSSISFIHLYYLFSHTCKFLIILRGVSGTLVTKFDEPISEGKSVQTNEFFFNEFFFQGTV